MDVLKWHREGKAVTIFLNHFLICEQGKQTELRNSSRDKGQETLFTVCHLDTYAMYIMFTIY